MTTTIKVFVVDDHELVRRGIVTLLEAEQDIDVVGEAGTAAQARARIAATRPDVAVLDMRLPDGNGIDVCRDIRSDSPAMHCIILTAYDDDAAISAAVLAGASDYVLKGVRGTVLLEKVRAVASGGFLLDSALSQRVVERMREEHQHDARLEALTTRESEVLALIAEGMTNRQIGETLELAEKTVKNYVSSLLSKLGLQRRTQAAVLRVEARPPGHQ
ncbi:response regulator transcription factor [Parafrigoribacterium mesophilum]|uniref:response regulator transcription factor n=1 Tax=Parafrigoribacterium mesophilum TaxID=433646 RepID=UPI0031FD6B90